MKKNTYLTLQSWMRDELDLSGNELIAYATIYGFSQDGDSKFSGSRQYIANWCGCSVRAVQNILNSLLERNLITKNEFTVNNVKHCEYVANFTPSEKISLPPSEKISPNNIEYNNIANSNTINSITENNNISKDMYEKPKRTRIIAEDESYFSMNESNDNAGFNKNSASGKKKNLFDKCKDEIYNFTCDIELQNLLTDYLTMRLQMKDKQIYCNQWKGMLNKLNSLANTKQGMIDIVNQSIEKAYASFYPISKYANKSANHFSESENMSCDTMTKEQEQDEQDFIEKLKREGKQWQF